jgi:putative acetyltransferase
MFEVRHEREEDQPAVHKINEIAFGQPDEADLVDALRKNARPYISLVAVEQGVVLGHILFSPVTIESKDKIHTVMGLAPMAVVPERQRQGIGSFLVREGLKECLRIGHPVVVVLGHADYYPRFGFVRAKGKGITCEYDVPEELFMVAELTPGALSNICGLAKYHPEFGKIT